MNVIIAHPKKAFVETVSRFVQPAEGSRIDRAYSLSELVEKITLDSYDVALVDGDLAGSEPSALLGILSMLNGDGRVIVTVRPEQEELRSGLARLGINEVILKGEGYLTALADALRREAQHTDAPEDAASARATISNASPTLRVGDEGYFVCDRRGRFLSVAPPVEKITGYGSEELLSLALTDLLSGDQETAVLRRLFNAAGETRDALTLRIRDKQGRPRLVTVSMRPLRDEERPTEIIGFRGTLQEIEERASFDEPQQFDQNRMIGAFIDLMHAAYNEPLHLFLRRIVEVTCQIFRFQRSTLALLDQRRQAFVKQALVGYSAEEGRLVEERALEVPREVIDRIFADRYRIKVLYHHQDERDTSDEDNPLLPDRRAQRRPPAGEWHRRDLVLLNLKDRSGATFGYISLENPEPDKLPTRSVFYNLELFSRLISLCLENYYRFSTLAKKNRRLQQILADSNLFRLQHSLTELLNETVWSAKHTLEFNLIALLLINKQSKRLEVRAAACEDRIKQVQLQELDFDVHEFGNLLKEEYRSGKSYLVAPDEEPLRRLKQIYQGADDAFQSVHDQPSRKVLLVPVRGQEGKIIGFLLADDPVEGRVPPPDSLRILEILAEHIAVAIENRVMFLEAKSQRQTEHPIAEPVFLADNEEEEDEEKGGFKRLVERFLR